MRAPIMNKQKGLSLVELMIAITLGLILMTGVMQVFLSSKTVYSTQQALSRIQETGRLAVEFMARDIRMAGYMGCASRTAGMVVTNTLNNPSKYQYDFTTALMGYTAETLPADHGLTPLPTANTDLFVLRGAFGSGVQVVQNNNGGQVNVTITTEEPGACADGSTRISGLCENDILVVSDCSKARVFQATNLTKTGGGSIAGTVNVVHAATGTPGNAVNNWGGSSGPESERFRNGSEVLFATTMTYFIGKGTSGRPSLWQNINGVNLELLEGVEDMSVKYGVDSDEDYVPNEYLPAAKLSATDWNKVIALRVELLVASVEDGVLPESQTYQFPTDEDPALSTVNPTDKRLRQVFTTTVGIRSRSF